MIGLAVPLGKLTGVAIRAHWSVLVVLVLSTQLLGGQVLPAVAPEAQPGWRWVAAGATAICFLGSLLAHELAHAVAARRFRVRTRRITLWMFGGAAELDSGPATPRAEFAIAVAGPVCSAAVSGVCWTGGEVLQGVLPPLVTTGLFWLGLSNAALALFNLLPAAPLDGGRVLRAVIWHHTGSRDRAASAADRGGMVLGGTLVLFGLGQALLLGEISGLWPAFVGWFVITVVQHEQSGNAMRRELGGHPVRALMIPDSVVARRRREADHPRR